MRETEDANMPFWPGEHNAHKHQYLGEGKMAYVDGDTVLTRQYGEVIAYINGNTILTRQYGEVIGDVATAKAAFPYRDDYVAAALYALSKLGRIEEK